MDKYKWTLTKTLRNAPISIQGGAAIENCIKPKNYADTLESNRSFTIPKGLSNRATKLKNIFSAFPEIELKKKIFARKRQKYHENWSIFKKRVRV